MEAREAGKTQRTGATATGKLAAVYGILWVLSRFRFLPFFHPEQGFKFCVSVCRQAVFPV